MAMEYNKAPLSAGKRRGAYVLFSVSLFWSRPYINFGKYCQQVKTKLIVLGALYNKITEGYTPKGTRIAAEQNDLCHSK